MGSAEQRTPGLSARRPQGQAQLVLVIDDDIDIAESIRDILRSGGYSVALATGGREALEVARQQPVGLVLLDWRLPDEPMGAALVRRLRDTAGLSVPIVVLSADPASLVEAREASVSDYLPKPFEIADLLHIVDSYFPG